MKTDHLAEFNWTFITTSQGHTHCYDPEGVQRCGSLTRRKKTPCRQKMVRNTGRCFKHQPNAKRGYEHPNTTKGNRSKYLEYLPSRVKPNFTELLENESLFELGESVALLDLFIQDLLPRILSGDPGQLWVDISATFDEMQDDLRAAMQGKDPEALARFLEQFREHGKLIKKGASDWRARKEVVEITNQRRQLVKTRADVEYRGENAITYAQFIMLLSFLEDLFERVNRMEDENERRQAYAEGLQKITRIEDIS